MRHLVGGVRGKQQNKNPFYLLIYCFMAVGCNTSGFETRRREAHKVARRREMETRRREATEVARRERL